MQHGGSRRTELRMDRVNRRWVIFSPARARRPSDFKSQTPVNPTTSKPCPFCVGHEHECAPEIFRIPENSHDDWKIRVIQNLYPALNRDLQNDLYNSQLNPEISPNIHQSTMVGFGFHDVIIESPVHSVQFVDLSPAEISDVLLAYKRRTQQLGRCHLIKYVQVFKNHGASAGASMSHSHSQIMGLPVIPPSVSTRMDSMKEHFTTTGRCILCDSQLKDLVIRETSRFVSFVPFASSFPFEIWVVPKEHSAHFHDLDDETGTDLGELLKDVLTRMSVQLNSPPYNFMIQTSPIQMTEEQFPHAHWFIQIVPQLTGLAGFEIGTGCHINPVFPEEASKLLRERGMHLCSTN